MHAILRNHVLRNIPPTDSKHEKNAASWIPMCNSKKLDSTLKTRTVTRILIKFSCFLFLSVHPGRKFSYPQLRLLQILFLPQKTIFIQTGLHNLISQIRNNIPDQELLITLLRNDDQEGILFHL
jgi:hypothetical protein